MQGCLGHSKTQSKVLFPLQYFRLRCFPAKWGDQIQSGEKLVLDPTRKTCISDNHSVQKTKPIQNSSDCRRFGLRKCTLSLPSMRKEDLKWGDLLYEHVFTESGALPSPNIQFAHFQSSVILSSIHIFLFIFWRDNFRHFRDSYDVDVSECLPSLSHHTLIWEQWGKVHLPGSPAWGGHASHAPHHSGAG